MLSVRKNTSHNVFISANGAKEPDLSDTDLYNKQKKQRLELVQSFSDVFNEKIGRTSKVKHENYYVDRNCVTCHHIVMLRLDEDLSKKIVGR